MRCWIDEKSGVNVYEPDTVDELLYHIWAIGYDYDGYSTADGLKSLVDELVEMAQKARDCLHDGKLFPKNQYGIDSNCSNCANKPYGDKEPCKNCYDRSEWRKAE